ncbi:MAG: cobaltochelatase subunit CobN [Isosphaeraceae bacterium]
MCLTERPLTRSFFGRYLSVLGLIAMLLAAAADAQEPPKKRAARPEPEEAAGSVRLKPSERKSRDAPVRLAVLTVRTNTPVIVEAYARFCEAHGKDKLAIDLWVQEDWAEQPRPLDFTTYDMIFALRCSIPGHEKAVAEAEKKGTWVVAQTTTKYGDAATALDDVAELGPYYRSRGLGNMIGFLEKVCELYKVPGVVARAMKEMPTAGIYHPDANRVFPDAATYWAWYAARPGYKADAPKVGLFLYNTLYLNEEFDYLTQLVRGVEAAGASPVLGFDFPSGSETPGGSRRFGVAGPGEVAKSDLILKFFTGVDVLVSSSFRLMDEKARHYDAMRKLDVPVLNGIILNITREEWEQSGSGLPPSYLLFGVVTPELAGLIEPTVVATRQGVTSPATGHKYHRTMLVPENYQRLVRRALAWSKLRRTRPADRKVAILYYNHAGGKQGIGASYLNVTESLARILADLGGRGYKVEGNVERRELLASMRAVGRNVGTWAPGEVDELVRNGAILWPLESYLAHFDRLPPAFKSATIRQWGQPPGDLMTVTRDGRRYFVLPVSVRGNIACAPQPARARGDRQDSSYHDPQLWPTHQYLAFYLWLRHEWKADAVVHLGRHGTHEFLPGKGNGLSWEDPPVVVLGDLPNVYPYIVDGIGEAVAAKRRATAVLVTHATPPITDSPLYGALADLRRKIDQYAQAKRDGQAGLEAELLAGIRKATESFGDSAHPAEPEHGHDVPSVEEIAHWLETVESQRAPRGLHTFGEPYSADSTAAMLPRMFADELASLKMDAAALDLWLAEAARAEAPSPPEVKTGDARSRVVATAWHMRHNGELDGLAHALEGGFVPVGPPGDPLSNPETFPTGRNQFQTDPAKLPSREAWAVGRRMAEQTLDKHRRAQGSPPAKLGFTLWANTLIRSQGALESEVLYLLGVEPVWNARGDVADVKLVTPALGRVRVDVVITITGMYRDTFADKVLLLDKAIRLAQEAPAESGQPNFVRSNTEAIARELTGRGVKPDEARQLARLRIFGAEPGQYGAGMHRVPDSNVWTDRGQIAGDYIDRMSFAFSADAWARAAPELFRRQLKGVEGVIHGRSSSLYGIIDVDDSYEYQGGMALAVEQVGGKAPRLYMNDLVGGKAVHDGREAVVLELLSRYHNPEFLRAMRDEGYDGAKYLSKVVDNQFGWDVTSDAIRADDWKATAEIYLADKLGLGLREFFEQSNPHALQNIASRVLEVDRKGLQALDSATKELAAVTYVESVARHGAACDAHICGGNELNALAARLAGATGRVTAATLAQFEQVIRKAVAPAGTSMEAMADARLVEGLIIQESSGQPSAPVQVARKGAGPSLGTNTEEPAAKPEVGPPPAKVAQEGEANGVANERRLIALALAACGLAFLVGIVRRSARHLVGPG